MGNFVFFILILLLFLCVPKTAFGIENPLNSANNKFGVHILFPGEITEANSLVNSNGGDWGYVIIPIQAGDKDLRKWQEFMDLARKHHIIPILRLASEGDYFNTKVWRKPTYIDVLDFANFLNSLEWPTKNRYIVVFNEVNRGDEWGGTPNPAEYAQLLSYSTSVFKSKSKDFFILPAGLDNAASNEYGSMNEFEYLRLMNQSVPGIFYQIDGISSHSYPNPGFSQPPSRQNQMSIATFQFEKSLIKSYTGRDLPVFITETGWTKAVVPEQTAAQYYKTAFETAWSDPSVVAVLPFLLKAQAGPFTVFSLINSNSTPDAQYKAIQSINKVRGNPVLPEKISTASGILGTTTKNNSMKERNFTKEELENKSIQAKQQFESFLNWLFQSTNSAN